MKLKEFKGTKTVMLHIGRCGSTVLTRMFRSYPEVDWQREAFKQSRRKKDLTTADALFDAVRNYPVDPKCDCFGFEIKPMHLDDFGVSIQAFVAFCRQQGFVRLVTLTRRNLLRKIISSQIGLATGQWRLKPEATPTTGRFHYQPTRRTRGLY